MPRFGRLQGQTIMEVFVGEKLFPMHPDLEASFIIVPAFVEVGWTFDGSTFTPPAKAPEPVVTLPDQLQAMLDSAAQQISAAVAAGQLIPPPGLFSQIAAISVGLKELTRLVPDKVYAVEAQHSIELLGVLPEPLELVRQQMLSTIKAGAQP